MASKTQLITTDIKELKELVSGYAILAKPCNTESLAAKIKEFLRNGPDKRMIEKAHKKALEFDYRRVIGRYLDIYSE
ncbi:TPA: glycosyltransferase family 4 protein [Candidatus Woesearchaeota archaeon]|nr:glycosyltransferase family 4 protein [Candidatus Woesearchaeota archaeon]